ncbi:MAG: type II secretion system minor pseudopilin GspH [Pseudomonadales bacterium]
MIRRAQGFTLIEILVVVFIVTILAGVTVMNLPQFARTGNLDTEARRIKVLLEMAREEALLQATELGFKPDKDGYLFFVYDEAAGRWSGMTERPFQPRQLDEAVTLALRVEDNEFVLGDEGRDMPPILLLSSGETTPFELTIGMRSGESSKTLVSDGIGELVWKADVEK